MHLYPQDPLPSNLQGALDLLLSRSCMLLEWACLRYAELYPSNASAELSWSALHLLSLALRMTGAGGRRPLTPDGDPKLVGPVKGRTHLVSMLSGRDHHCRPGGLATLQAVLSTQESAADIRSAAEHLLPELQVLAQQARDEEDENTEGCEKTDRGDNIHVPPASLPLPTSKMDTFHATVGENSEGTRQGKERSDLLRSTLPSEQRQGLSSCAVHWHCSFSDRARRLSRDPRAAHLPG